MSLISEDSLAVGSWRDKVKKVNAVVKPSFWKEETKQEVVDYYFGRYGLTSDLSKSKLSEKITPLINKSYNVNVSCSEVESLLDSRCDGVSLRKMPEKSVSQKTFRVEEEPPSSIKFNISLEQKKYPYKENIPSVSEDSLDLCVCSNCKGLCFSQEKGLFYLTCDKNICSVNKGLTSQEKVILELFKENLKDEVKALKLVFLLRNQPSKSKTIHNDLEDKI